MGFGDLLPLPAALSPNENPYIGLSSILKGYLTPQVSHSAIIQLEFLIAVHGVIILLALAALVIRWKKSIFFVFRRHVNSPLIMPHFSVPLSLVTVAILPLFELLFVRSIQTFEDPIPPADFGYIVLFVGASPWLICETVVWSLTSTYLVDLASKGSNIDSRAYVCNVVGIVSPSVVLVFTLVYSILGGKAYSDAVETFDKLDSMLLDLGAQWTREDDITSLLPPSSSLLGVFELQLERIELTWRANFLLQAISGTLLLLVLAAVAIPYLYGLHKSLKQMDTVLGSSTNGEGSRNSGKLRSAWLSLLITLSVFAVCCTVQVALNYVVYAEPFNLQDPKWSQAILFVPFFATGILGLPCGWLLFWTALKAQSERKDQGWSLWYTEVGGSTRRAEVCRVGSGSGEGSRDVEGDGGEGGEAAFAREEWIAVLGRNDSRAGQTMRENENEGKELEKQQAGVIGV